MKKIRKIIFHSKPNKALKIDEIFNQFFRQITKKLLSKIIHLFQIYLKIKYYSTEFKKTNIIILRKLKKTTIRNPNRSIVLLNILSKIFEIIITIKLNDCVETNKVIFYRRNK